MSAGPQPARARRTAAPSGADRSGAHRFAQEEIQAVRADGCLVSWWHRESKERGLLPARMRPLYHAQHAFTLQVESSPGRPVAIVRSPGEDLLVLALRRVLTHGAAWCRVLLTCAGMCVLAVLCLLCGAAVTAPTSSRARVLGQHGWRAPRAQSKMLFGAPPPPPPSLGASLQRQLGEVAPLLVSAVTIVGALLGANNFIDNRIETSSKEAAAANKELAMQIANLSKETAMQIAAASKEAAAANKELAMQIAAASKEAAAANKELAMQIADLSKETAMQIANLSKETAIGVVVSICIAVFALFVGIVAVIIAQRQPNR